MFRSAIPTSVFAGKGRQSRWFCSKTKAEIVERKLSISSTPNSAPDLPDRYVGQPSYRTHPKLMTVDDVTPGTSRVEYADRRQEFLRQLREETRRQAGDRSFDTQIAVIPASTVYYSAPDVPFVFRQDSNFLYLSGFHEPDSVLVLYNEADECRSALFVGDRDPNKERWEGPMAGVDGARALTGVDSALERPQLAEFIRELLERPGKPYLWFDPARLALNSPVKNERRTLSQLPNVLAESRPPTLNPYSILHKQRWRKSPSEVRLLRSACSIGSQAMIETMRFSRQNRSENVLCAKMDLESRLRGAGRLAYPPVIAGGARANTIHYLNIDQNITERENLVLMDAGCEVQGYVSDITRTWPVSGRFTDPQRVLYEIVYDVQQQLLTLVQQVRPLSLRDIYLCMLELLGFHLREAGVLSTPCNDSELHSIASRFCPHHVSHYLGMDVHDVDTVPKNIPLLPGVVLTVEPGLYVLQDDTSVRPEFRGIGIRIEDDVLITDTGADVLTEECPKAAAEIEALLA